jgi:hypothetical protein
MSMPRVWRDLSADEQSQVTSILNQLRLIHDQLCGLQLMTNADHDTFTAAYALELFAEGEVDAWLTDDAPSGAAEIEIPF